MEVVSIAIASIGRPCLADTLRSLAKLDPLDDVRVCVLVADDTHEHAATRLAESLDLGNLALRCLAVGSANISTARNALLDAADGDWLAMVDDDEWVERDWLARLMECAREHEADVVVGPVFPRYPADAPPWLVRADPLYVEWGHRGKRLTSGRGGNTLVRMDMVRRLKLRFDPALGVSGGEDTAFFSEAATRGARIVATDDAIAHEHVPPERLTPDYILARAVRSGQSYANTRRAEHPDPVWRLLFTLNALAKTIAAAVLALALWPIDRASFFRMRQKLARNRGKLRAALALPLAELYKQPDQIP